LSPGRSAGAQVVPKVLDVVWPLSGENAYQSLCLRQVLARLGGALGIILVAQLGNDQFMKRIPGWIRNIDRDASSTESYAVDLLVKQEVQIA